MIELAYSDIIQVWIMGVIFGIGLGVMLYLIGYAFGFIYKLFKM